MQENYIYFEGKETIIKRDFIAIEGGEIPIILKAVKDKNEKVFYFVYIDGITWLATENTTHAIILYSMLRDNITDYMQYVKTNN